MSFWDWIKHFFSRLLSQDHTFDTNRLSAGGVKALPPYEEIDKENADKFLTEQIEKEYYRALNAWEQFVKEFGEKVQDFVKHEKSHRRDSDFFESSLDDVKFVDYPLYFPSVSNAQFKKRWANFWKWVIVQLNRYSQKHFTAIKAESDTSFAKDVLTPYERESWNFFKKLDLVFSRLVTDSQSFMDLEIVNFVISNENKELRNFLNFCIEMQKITNALRFVYSSERHITDLEYHHDVYDSYPHLKRECVKKFEDILRNFSDEISRYIIDYSKDPPLICNNFFSEIYYDSLKEDDQRFLFFLVFIPPSADIGLFMNKHNLNVWQGQWTGLWTGFSVSLKKFEEDYVDEILGRFVQNADSDASKALKRCLKRDLKSVQQMCSNFSRLNIKRILAVRYEGGNIHTIENQVGHCHQNYLKLRIEFIKLFRIFEALKKVCK